MTRSSSQLKNTNNNKNCLPDRWDGVCLLVVFFSTKYLLGCADNRSELHCKDERDSGNESRNPQSRDKIAVVQIWQAAPLPSLLGIHFDGGRSTSRRCSRQSAEFDKRNGTREHTCY